MPLAEQEKPTNTIKQVGETGQAVEKELEEAAEQAEKAVREGAPRQTADVPESKKTESLKKTEVSKEELEGRSIKDLEVDLADKLLHTKIADIENSPVINSIIDKISEKITDKDYKDENIASLISDIAYRTSSGEVGTYAWLLDKLENRVNEELQKKSKM